MTLRIIGTIVAGAALVFIIAFGISTYRDHEAAQKAAVISPDLASSSSSNTGSGANGAGDASGGGNH
jgi:hypothetical protein